MFCSSHFLSLFNAANILLFFIFDNCRHQHHHHHNHLRHHVFIKRHLVSECGINIENISTAINMNTVPHFVGLNHLSSSVPYGVSVIGIYKKICAKHVPFPIL
jgi:hypothetical protein